MNTIMQGINFELDKSVNFGYQKRLKKSATLERFYMPENICDHIDFCLLQKNHHAY